MNNIGERITVLRKKKGFSQTQLAQLIGVSREAIGKYERNEASPSVDTAKKIADVLEVTLDFLVDEKATNAFDKKTLNRITDIQNLNPIDQGHLFAIVDAFLRDAKTKMAYIN